MKGVIFYGKGNMSELRKTLTYCDYETYYDEEYEDTSYYILCSSCWYNELEDRVSPDWEK